MFWVKTMKNKIERELLNFLDFGVYPRSLLEFAKKELGQKELEKIVFEYLAECEYKELEKALLKAFELDKYAYNLNRNNPTNWRVGTLMFAINKPMLILKYMRQKYPTKYFDGLFQHNIKIKFLGDFIENILKKETIKQIIVFKQNKKLYSIKKYDAETYPHLACIRYYKCELIENKLNIFVME